MGTFEQGIAVAQSLEEPEPRDQAVERIRCYRNLLDGARQLVKVHWMQVYKTWSINNAPPIANKVIAAAIIGS